MAHAEFKDKVVLITGAGRGLGRCCAEAFAARQAIVALNDLTPINLDTVLERIITAGGRAKDYVFDVSKKISAQTMIDLVLTDWGRIDILVNHSAVCPRADLLTMDEWDWQRTLDLNLTGPFLALQRVGQVMRYQGGGVMVNLLAGLPDPQDWHGRAAFAASQAGVIGLTRQAARELAADQIRLNALRLEGSPETASFEYMETFLEKLFFLCSEASTDITGQLIEVATNGRPEDL